MNTLLLLGFLVGMRHALEADHVAAIASLATRCASVRQTVNQGILWGIGHTVTLFIFGSSVIWLNIVMPERLARIFELTVGVMLLILGIDVIRRVVSKRIHFHIHRHEDGNQHFHAHAHTGNTPHHVDPHSHSHDQACSVRALFVGLMHGMAGSAALVVLTLETVDSPGLALLYIALFGTGSILGMALLSTMIAIPLRKTAIGLNRVHNGLQLFVGTVTLTLGCLIVYENNFL